ncbi:MAG TPA: hypothetical protein DDW49_06580 [Deltaproteobacteria bacterium]|nr:hypothetical protein [Deltaproteobacteria bacterium]
METGLFTFQRTVFLFLIHCHDPALWGCFPDAAPIAPPINPPRRAPRHPPAMAPLIAPLTKPPAKPATTAAANEPFFLIYFNQQNRQQEQ